MTDKRKATGRDPDGSEEHSTNDGKDNPARQKKQKETCTEDYGVGELAVFKACRVCIPWANRPDKKTGKPRKIPFDAHSSGPGNVSDPNKWGTLAEAQDRDKRIPKPHGGGIGIVLGNHGAFWLSGIDLDSCRDKNTGAIAPWATEVIDHYPGYWEISPSQTGLKGFFLIDGNATDILKSKVFPKANRDPSVSHGPQIEFYSSGRWFAVTGQKYGNGSC